MGSVWWNLLGKLEIMPFEGLEWREVSGHSEIGYFEVGQLNNRFNSNRSQFLYLRSCDWLKKRLVFPIDIDIASNGFFVMGDSIPSKNKKAAFGGRAQRRKKMLRKDLNEILCLGVEEAASNPDGCSTRKSLARFEAEATMDFGSNLGLVSRSSR